MIRKHRVRAVKFTKKSAFNILVLFTLLYFVFHSIYGSRGIIAYFKLQAELEKAHNRLDILRAERLEMENRTGLLRPGSLDRDMLEEKARNILGIVSPNEQVFKREKIEEKQEEELK